MIYGRIRGIEKFIEDLRLLALPDKKKREILLRTLQKLKAKSVKTARAQKSPEGGAWKPRKNGTAKMLRRIAGLINSQSAPEKGKLYYKQKRTGEIAAEHQEGIDHLFKKSEFKTSVEKAKGEPATRKQAKKLKDLGYSVPTGKTKKGKPKRRKPTIKEIVSTLSRNQAGVIIRKMQTKGHDSQGLTKWIIPTEKRPFLHNDADETAKILFDELNKYKNNN